MPAQPDIVKRVLRRFLRTKAPAATKEKATTADRPDALLRMIEGIREAPLDPTLCYELGVALLRKGIDNDGVRYLDRSFRLDPLNIVRFVKAPDLKQVRLRGSVIALLTRLRRDEEQRSFGAYA